MALLKPVRIVMPRKLVAEIDELVGRSGRRAFIEETATRELRRRWLLAFLRSDEPAWKDQDHPELVEKGTAAWVREMRGNTSQV